MISSAAVVVGWGACVVFFCLLVRNGVISSTCVPWGYDAIITIVVTLGGWATISTRGRSDSRYFCWIGAAAAVCPVGRPSSLIQFYFTNGQRRSGADNLLSHFLHSCCCYLRMDCIRYCTRWSDSLFSPLSNSCRSRPCQLLVELWHSSLPRSILCAGTLIVHQLLQRLCQQFTHRSVKSRRPQQRLSFVNYSRG